MKRIFPCLLLLILPLLLSSCGLIVIHQNPAESQTFDSETDFSAVTSSEQKTDRPDTVSLPEKIPDVDLGGVAVFITCASGGSYFSADDDSSSLSSAVSERNRIVEEKLNTSVLTKNADLSVMESEIRASCLSGVYYTDLIAVPASSIGYLQKSGLLTEINTLPYVDLSFPCYSQNAVEQFSLAGSVFAVAGDATIVCESLPCIFVNNTLAASLGIEGLASLTSKGEWTIEKLSDAISGSTRIFGVYGFGFDEDRGEIASRFFLASGGKFYSAAEDGFALNAGKEREEKIVSSLRFLYDPSYRFDGKETSALQCFYDGKLLFYFSDLGKGAWLVDMKDDWGILPLPKANVDQSDYISPVSASSAVIAVPAGNTAPDRAGIFLQTLFAASNGTMENTGVDLYIEKYARNNDSLNAVWTICRSPFYSFHTLYGSYNAVFTNASVVSLDAALANGASWQTYAQYYAYALRSVINTLS